jgi:arginase family enzyme
MMKSSFTDSNFLPLCFNVDDSVLLQGNLTPYLEHVADLRNQELNLRLWANELGLEKFKGAIENLQRLYPSMPWLTFLGSGDLHHLTLVLLESFQEKFGPFHLVLIDNHPDWFKEKPKYHCGNWLASVLDMPQLISATLVGQDSEDLRGTNFGTAPLKDLYAGRVKLYPYARSRIHLPFRWPQKVLGVSSSKRNLLGVNLALDTVACRGAHSIFSEIAMNLAGQNVYISIDKDCLRPEDAMTDWEQGQLSLEEVVAGIHILKAQCHIIGADICGEKAPLPLKGFLKQVDSGRLFKKEESLNVQLANRLNESTNLALLQSFLGENAPIFASEETSLEGSFFDDKVLCP